MPRETVLFLGYDEGQTRLIKALRNRGFHVDGHADRISDLSSHDHVVSFGYRHILKQSDIESARRPIVNLHISLLPHNRGAHPNFWAWVERSPHGVTLHEIDAGLDTGPIIAQERVEFPSDTVTLRHSQSVLIDRIERLFLASFPQWISGAIEGRPQKGEGSYHRACDLPKWVENWDMTAAEAKARYDAKSH